MNSVKKYYRHNEKVNYPNILYSIKVNKWDISQRDIEFKLY